MAPAADPAGVGFCERYRPVLLAEGTVQDRHEELDVELLEACAAHDADVRGGRCTTISSSRRDIYTVELKGRSIFAF